MNSNSYQKLTGILFLVGSVLVNIPYTLLIMNFDYPDILRGSTGHILTQFQEGGTSLIITWFLFALLGIPLIFAIIMLHKVFARENSSYLWSGTFFGLIGAIAQIIGLLRWAFVVPILAKIYTDPNSSIVAKDSAVIVFQAIHQYGGVVIGEHIGQTFTIIWMLLVSVAILRSEYFKSWIAWFGIGASAVYCLGQTEPLATVIPNIFVIPATGLIGSLLWLSWMIVIGINLIRTANKM